MSRSLDFVGGLKKRAVAARGYRIQISSKSGTKFRSQESFQIELPTIARSYADLANMYLMFDIKSTSSAAANQGHEIHPEFRNDSRDTARGVPISNTPDMSPNTDRPRI